MELENAGVLGFLTVYDIAILMDFQPFFITKNQVIFRGHWRSMGSLRLPKVFLGVLWLPKSRFFLMEKWFKISQNGNT